MAASSCDSAVNHGTASCDTLEAMVVSCSPASQLLQGSVASIMGGKRTAMVNAVIAGEIRAYNEGYIINEIMEGGGGDGIAAGVDQYNHAEALAAAGEDEPDDSGGGGAYCTSSDYLYKPEKKRRLSPDQVRRLEKSFEVDNKLEPERKLQLANDLRLHPRQVSVWFQNRRARWKAKQLEKDYDALKLSHITLQAHFDALLKEKQELLHEVISLSFKAELQQAGDNIIASNNIIGKEKETSKENNGEKQLVPTVNVNQELLHHEMDKQIRDGEKRLHAVAEVSALSGTEESAVSEAVNSPHAIDSGVNSKEDIGGRAENAIIPAINDHTNYVTSSCSAAAIKIDDLQGAVFPKILALEPIVAHVKAEMEEDENYSKYSFILEDQGAFPWWNSTSWA